MIASALLALSLAVAADDAPPPSPRVLLVTGVDHPAHDWKQTTPVVRQIAESAGCQVDVAEDPDVLASDRIFNYDALILHFANPQPLPHDAQARSNLEKFVKEQGRGLVVIHFASGAFPDWPEYRDLIGRVWDKVNTHDPRGPFRVHVTNTTSPITKALADFDADDELYIGLAGEVPVDVLAQAHSKVTDRDHPMAFTFHCAKGRVFHTPLGHDAKALQMPGTAELLKRGIAWAATKPADSPLNVETTDTSWSVSFNGQKIADYRFAPGQFKPYLRELAAPGSANILRDAPFDHLHHHGVMFAIRVNGINFWEEVAPAGVERPVATRFETATEKLGPPFKKLADTDVPCALIHQRILWLAPDDAKSADPDQAEQKALLVEDRTLSVAPVPAIGSPPHSSATRVRWHSAFTVNADKVTLTGSNYNGLGMRFRQDLDPLARFLNEPGQMRDLGDKQIAEPGTAGLTYFDTPTEVIAAELRQGSDQNPGTPHIFGMKQPFSYIALTPGLDKTPLEYKKGDRFEFDFRIHVAVTPQKPDSTQPTPPTP